jgi:hypothetical protein
LRIDSSDANSWKFPVGTIFFKEFTKFSKRLEVRVLKKIREAESNSWIFGTYVWNDEESEATLNEWAIPNLKNTQHDVPSRAQCYSCHTNDKYIRETNVSLHDIRPLGFDALDLAGSEAVFEPCKKYWHSHNGAVQNPIDLNWLLSQDRLTHSHDWSAKLPELPGSSVSKAAFAYMHNNCGACHAAENSEGRYAAATFTQMYLRAKVGVEEPQKMPAYTSTVQAETVYYREIDRGTSTPAIRVVPGKPLESVLFQRFSSTVPGERMPATGSRQVDEYGACVLRAWIQNL